MGQYKDPDYMRKYRKEHRKELNEKNNEWKSKNKEKVKEYRKESDLRCKEHIAEYQKEYHRERRHKDICYRLLHNLRIRLSTSIKRRSETTIDFIGCSIENLISFLESKFQEGMTWDNYGKWHIDHIRPCASFNFLNEEEQKQCFH
jgi:hypothetical protein